MKIDPKNEYTFGVYFNTVLCIYPVHLIVYAFKSRPISFSCLECCIFAEKNK